MTLTHLFKAQAIFAWIWAVMFWLAPEMAASGPGWEVTPNAISFGQVVSVPMFALGIISWNAPAWVGDNLKKVGMILGVYINILFIAVQLFHVSTGAANFDPLGMIPTIIFAALFFWKCRASD
jgi:hypothetical protein